MLRYVLPLCAAMFVALLIAGEDKGQMRPGLARAVATGEEIVMVERRFSPTVVASAEPDRKILTTDDLPPPIEIAAAPAIASVPKAEPTAPEAKPVFTLSSLPGPSGDAASIEAASGAGGTASASLYADPTDGGALSPEPSGYGDAYGGTSDIRTVSASSVNVRLGPSTETSVVGRLSAGEAVRVLGAVDSEWVEIAIEGDGLSGYVAARFLAPGY